MIKLSNGLMADLSTLRVDRLAKLPKHTLTRPGRHMGAGCFLDPPGFPTYFLRMVEGRNDSGYVITIGGESRFVSDEVLNESRGWYRPNWRDLGAPADHQERLAWLYQPLPFEHPRVQCWIDALHKYMRNCYRVPGAKNDMLVFPPGRTDFVTEGLFVAKPDTTRMPFFTEHLTEEGRRKLEAAIAEATAEAEREVKAKQEARTAEMAKLCTVDTHLAVLAVRKFYPDYQPSEARLAGEIGRTHAGDWYGVLAERPVPCPCNHQAFTLKTFGFVCQYCGAEDLPERPEDEKRPATHYHYHNEAAADA